MFNPKVSIVIPVYNGANYMQEAIDSALAQTYKNIEVIVINDGSRDGGKTKEIAESYGNKIRFFDKENGGVATALNLGIEKMEGEYFSWLSHDDKYKPEKIEVQICELEKLEDKTTLLFGGYENFRDDTGVFETLDFYEKFGEKNLSKPLFPVFHMTLNGCTLLIHKSHFERVGRFDPALPTTQDYDLWFRMFRGQHAHCVPGCQVLSRCHEQQGSKALLGIHFPECEKLWLKCLSLVKEQEMIDLSGSPYAFYSELYKHFSENCGYAVVNQYLKQQALACLTGMNMGTDELFDELYCSLRTYGREQEIIDAAKAEKTRIRLAFFLGDINALGGLNRIVLKTAANLTAYFDVWLIDTLKYNGTGYELNSRIHEVTVGMDIAQITQILTMLKIDVLIGNYNCLNWNLELYKEVKYNGIRVIAWNHEHYLLPYMRNSDFGTNLGYRDEIFEQLDAVVWLTEYSGQIYAMRHDNGIVLPNMLSISKSDMSQSNKMEKLNWRCNNDSQAKRKNKQKYASNVKSRTVIKKSGEKLVIAVSRFDDEGKGLDKLIKVFASIHTEYPQSRLLLVGSIDWQKTCRVERSFCTGERCMTYGEILAENKLTHADVISVGVVKDVVPYYEMADLHLFTSGYEGFGLVIVEAASFGVPTIAFAGNGYDSIIDDGINGFIVNDACEMAKKAVELLRDNELMTKVRSRTAEILIKFNEEEITSRWCELIEQIVHNPGIETRMFFKAKMRGCKQLTYKDLEHINSELEIANYQFCERLKYQPQTNTVMDSEAERMRQTISWRITKPMRIATLIRRSIAEHGVKETGRKIMHKLSKR